MDTATFLSLFEVSLQRYSCRWISKPQAQKGAGFGTARGQMSCQSKFRYLSLSRSKDLVLAMRFKLVLAVFSYFADLRLGCVSDFELLANGISKT